MTLNQPPSPPAASNTVDPRDRLVQAAMRLYAEHGFSGVSMRGIGAAAGQKNKSAVAYHFDSKVGLMNAVYDQLHVFLAPRVDALLSELEQRPLEKISMYEIGLCVSAPLFALYMSKPDGVFAIKTLARFTQERPDAVDPTYWHATVDAFQRASGLVRRLAPNKSPGQIRFHLSHYVMATLNGLAALPNWPGQDFEHDPELMFEVILSYVDYVAAGLAADESNRPRINVAFWKAAILP